MFRSAQHDNIGQWLGFAQKFYWRLLRFGFEFRMFKGALFLALGFFAVCFPVVAQQAKHSGAVQHRVAASALMPLDVVSNFSIYRPNVMNASNPSILFHNGPVRAWSDGAQLVSESALAANWDGAARVISSDVFGSERYRTRAHQEAKRRFQFSIANGCDRWKRFAR